MDDDVRALAAQLQQQGDDRGSSVFIRKGVVTVANRASLGSSFYNKYSVRIGGIEVADIPAMDNTQCAVGDLVYVLFDDAAPIIIGVRSNVPRGLVGSCVLNQDGVSGRFAYAYGSTAQSVAVDTNPRNTGLGINNAPVGPNRLLKISFEFWAAGPVNTGVEWYFLSQVNFNYSGWNYVKEHRFAPSGGNAGSPMGFALVTTPSDANAFSMVVNIILSTGSGTLYQWAGASDKRFRSNLIVEDLGPA